MCYLMPLYQTVRICDERISAPSRVSFVLRILDKTREGVQNFYFVTPSSIFIFKPIVLQVHCDGASLDLATRHVPASLHTPLRPYR